MKKLSFLGLLLLCTAAAAGDDAGAVLFERLNPDPGMINQSVSSILMDEQGFLWFGTQGGLYRYDGQEFIAFENRPFELNSLPHNLVQTLEHAPGDILWVGTYQGLSRFDAARRSFTNYASSEDEPGSLSDNVVVAVEYVGPEEIWVGTLNGLNRFNPRTGLFTRFFHDPDDPGSLAHDVVRDIHYDRGGRLWVATNGGLDLWDPGEGRFIHFAADPEDPTALPSPYAMVLLEEPDGGIWVGTWGGGLSLLDPDTGSFETVRLPDLRVYSLARDEDGAVWAGTWGGGLHRYDPGSGEVEVYRDGGDEGLGNDVIYALSFDAGGNLWVGTNGGGVYKYIPGRRDFTYLAHDEERSGGLPGVKINTLLSEPGGVLWIGTYNAGLWRYDERSGRLHAFPSSGGPGDLASDNITSLSLDREGELWVTTQAGFGRYNREDENFDLYLPDPGNPFGLKDPIVYDFLHDSRGRYWIGTYNHGLARFDPESENFTFYSHDPDDQDSISDNLVYTIQEDSRGTLWVGTNHGLNRYDETTDGFVRYELDRTDPAGVNSNTIRAITEDSAGRLWIGTGGGGLNRYLYESDSFRHHTRDEGLSDNVVLAIEEDRVGRLWLATQYGITIFDPEEGSSERLDEADGFEDIHFNLGSARDEEGRLYFSSVGRIYRVAHFDVTRNTSVPPVHITGITVLNHPAFGPDPVYREDALILDAEDRYLRFDYVALDYNEPRKNRYRYMLEGYDDDWIDAGNSTQAIYTRIPPGRYTFRVVGSNNDGIWNDEGDSLELLMAAPFWRRWWAFLLYAAAGGALVLLLLRLRTTQILKEKVVELERLKGDLERANDSLERLSTHDSLTGLTNRRRFDAYLDGEIERAKRNKSSLAVIMLDIDFFKRYNDRYGHPAGDECLRRIADILSGSLKRDADMLCRYGGEEFSIVLPDTDGDGAFAVCDEIRRSLKEARIPHEDSEVSPWLTISMGLTAGVPSHGVTPRQFIQAADQALYRAKREGRNTIRR